MEPEIAMDIVHSIPKDIIFPKLPNVSKWSGYIRGSPMRLPEADGKVIVELLANYKGQNQEYPIKAKVVKLESDKTNALAPKLTDISLNEYNGIWEYIPPIFSKFVQLSKSEGSSTEFERKTALLLTSIGYTVEVLGQGKGRKLDSIARGLGYNDRPMAFLVDCKARRDGNYAISSGDERALIEYIDMFFRNPKNKGYDPYLLLISSGFNDSQNDSIKRIKNRTKIKGIILLEAEELLKLLYKRLTDSNFDIPAICDQLTDKAK